MHFILNMLLLFRRTQKCCFAFKSQQPSTFQSKGVKKKNVRMLNLFEKCSFRLQFALTRLQQMTFSKIQIPRLLGLNSPAGAAGGGGTGLDSGSFAGSGTGARDTASDGG